MNVIFLDFDGTLITLHEALKECEEGKEPDYSKLEKRIAILSEICKKYNCKVVISSGTKHVIDEETMEIAPEAIWTQKVFELFKKYEIECIGRTPNVKKYFKANSYVESWKEDEIRLYLYRHPEIEHYAVLDDNDTQTLFHWDRSDLEKVKGHLVQTVYYNRENPEDTGILEKHIDEVGKVLQKENEVRKLALRRDRIKANRKR